jgi:hypothetical protein
MYINKLIKKQIILSISTFLIVVLILLGSSYALFETTSTNNETQTLAVGDLSVVFTNGNTINLTDINPETDTEAAAETNNIYTFTIQNNGTVAYSYTIRLIDNPDYLSGGTNYNANVVLLSHNYIRYSLNGVANNTLSAATDGYIYSGVLPAGESITYNLRVWVADAITYNLPNEALGSEVHLNIIIDGQASKPVLATSLIALSGQTQGDGGIESINETASSQLSAVTEYRYYGNNPNNYVRFNNELWRIIGVFETENESGTLENRVKIVRNTSIGSYSWDSSTSSVNSGNGINEWSVADLMKLLNPGYESDSVNNSLFYSKLSGTCYNSSGNVSTACDFTSSGINSAWKNYISKAKYYLGTNTSLDATASSFYGYERGTTTVSSPADNITRTTNMLNYFGLIYPSDYGYSTSSGGCARTTNLTSYGSTSACHTANWLWDSSGNLLTITPSANNAYSILAITNSGTISEINASTAGIIKPVVYLKANVKKLGGTGTNTNPYTLSI